MRRAAVVLGLALLALAPAAAHAEEPIRVFGSSGDGEGQFLHPRGIAIDADGYVYVADSEADRVTKLTPDGRVVRIIGSPDEEDDGEELRDDELSSPMGVAVAPDGSIVVAEAAGHTRVSRWGPDGSYRGSFSTFGVDPGQLASPQGLAVAADGTVYVADTGGDRVSAFAADGTFLGVVGAGPSGPGEPGLASPGGVAVDADATVWVTDGTFDELKHYAADGTFLGALPIDGDPGFEDGATGVAIGPGHVFHVASPPSDLVRRWSDTGVQLPPVGNGEGEEPGETSRPEYVAFDCRGRLYLSDGGNDRIQVFGDASAPACGMPDDGLHVTLGGAPTQRFRQRFAVVVRPECPGSTCTVTLGGRVAIQGRRAVLLRSRAVRVGEPGRDLMVEARPGATQRIVAALQAGRRVTATIDAAAVDASGGVATASIIVRLR